jgi:hypothetical protein
MMGIYESIRRLVKLGCEGEGEMIARALVTQFTSDNPSYSFGTGVHLLAA